jgi:hypothetical protein
MVWDAHFGPNEGGVMLENLENDPYLKKVKSFYPVEKVTVLGGYDYSVQVYEKSINKGDSVVITDNYEQILTFDNYLNEHVKEVDGYKVWELNSSQEYSPTISFTPDVLKRYEILEIAIALNYKALQPLTGDQAMLVFSVESDVGNLRYEKADLISSENNWSQQQLNIKMPANLPESSKILVYVWNKDKKNIWIEKLKIEVKSY